MGKKLIIKGADFSANHIVMETYTRLLWVTSNGENQHFELPIKLTPNKRIEVDFSVPQELVDKVLTSGSERHYICGSSGGTAKNWGHIGFFKYYSSSNPNPSANNNIICTFGLAKDQYAGNNSYKITDGSMHTVSICRNSLQLDDITPVDISASNVDLDSYGSSADVFLWVMGCNITNGGSSDIHIHGFRSYTDYTDNSSIEMNLFPVRKWLDNKIYMYDSINDIYIRANDNNDPLYSTI